MIFPPSQRIKYAAKVGFCFVLQPGEMFCVLTALYIIFDLITLICVMC
jgi:hypothetical protein